MQGKLFWRCTHLLYCSVLSLGGNVNTRRILQPDTGSIFHIKNQWKILVIGSYYVNYQNYLNLMLLGYWTNTDASILVYKFRQERTGFNMYAKYTQLKLTFLALQPWAGLGWIFNWIQIEIRETNPKRCITRFRYWQAPYNGGGC